jgi:PPK2 family polyphosphate:nucleotide phosphotransferase
LKSTNERVRGVIFSDNEDLQHQGSCAVKLKNVIKEARALSRPYAVTKGASFRLKDVDPADTGPFSAGEKNRAEDALKTGVKALAELQDMLYAHDKWGVLLIFQAMDAAGKDGAIKHVMSGVNPQGCQVASFKAPSAEELDHDFLWRCQRHLPERGRIGIFNRSYYEEVLIVRVHPELLAKQKLPVTLAGKDIWKNRYRDIRAFERYMSDNGILVRKFFLHLSKAEQKKRFLERIDNPAKNWKFSAADVAERGYWKDYMAAYEDMIRNTATPEAPWYVVPADHKWFTRMVVAAAVVDAIGSLKLTYPEVGKTERARLAGAKEKLLGEKR